MNICKNCGKEYNPSYDFVEDVELLEGISRYVDIETHCSNCVYAIDEQIQKFVNDKVKI